MPLELIGVGFGRTGTDSTRLALNQLGLPCYHMFEVLENPANRPEHLDFWHRVATTPPGEQHAWETVFANYRATVDNPAAAVWRELLDAYPDAKVLLTLHPGGPDAWYESTWETIHAPQRSRAARLAALFIPPVRKIQQMTGRLIWERFHEGTMHDRAAAIARYHAHAAEVRAAVPAERLLEFRASDGWEPLCAFLGLPVPDAPFPRSNDRAAMQARMRRVALSLYAALGVAAVGIALAAWGLWALLA